MSVLKKIFNAAASHLPVIGPHAGIEADLLLAGLKPVGMLPVKQRPENPKAWVQELETRLTYEQKIFDGCRALEKEVSAGRLIHKELPVSERTSVHYYYRPGQEAVVNDIIAWDKSELVDKQGPTDMSQRARELSMTLYKLDMARASQPEALQKGELDVARVFRDNNEARPDPEVPRRNMARWIKDCDDLERLDAAVAAGKLKSADLLLPPLAPGRPNEILRHYCQPGQEKQMETVLRQNEEWLAKKSNVQILDKDIGEYLGYRKKDIDLWYGLPGLRQLPLGIGKAVYNAAVWASVTFAQEAYHSHMVDKAQKVIQRPEKPAAPKR